MAIATASPLTDIRTRLTDIRGSSVIQQVYWILRIGVMFEFVGHGLAGWSKSQAWIPYFGLFGFSEQFSNDYMFYFTATVDTIAGLIILFRPMRIVLLYMAVWGTFTAFLRPASGESWHEVLERGGNYGMPLAMLLLVGLGSWNLRSWFEKADPPAALDRERWIPIEWVMRVGLALLLIGHGGFGLHVRKPEWYDYFGFFGISESTVDSANLMTVFGLFEMALGVAVLLSTWRPLLLFILAWKLITELLRPLTGQQLFQFIERSGDYALPLALFVMAGAGLTTEVWRRSRVAAQAAVVQPSASEPNHSAVQ